MVNGVYILILESWQRPSIRVKAPEKYLSTAVAFPGNHGTGEMKLLSLNPSDHPVIDPKFLPHPFDKRVAIESVRETLELLGKSLMAKSTVRLAAGPSENTDVDILVRKNHQPDTKSTLQAH